MTWDGNFLLVNQLLLILILEFCEYFVYKYGLIFELLKEETYVNNCKQV